jgi:hypothetical protein
MINADTPTPTLFKAVFSFPNPVNEVAARLVATMVLTLTLLTIATGQWWLMPILAYGFLARVLTGPTLSPMGLLATRVLVPWMGDRGRLVPGPPKRFAQSVGLVFSVSALALYFVTDGMAASRAVLSVLAVFAALEAVLGFCAGCLVFNYAMRWGLIPESMCEECRIDVEPLTA